MNIVVLDGFAVNPGDLSWGFLEKYGTVSVYEQTEDKRVTERLSDAEAVFTNRKRIDGAVLDRCPKIKYVSALGTGYDMIDVAECRRRSITVCNAPGYSSDSVSQLAFTLLLNIFTDLNGLANVVKDGLWTGVPGFAYQNIRFEELAGKTLGLVGCGNIGRRVADMALAFKMRVCAFTRTRCAGSCNGVEYMPLWEMLKVSDAVSMHCPLCDDTRGMVNAEFIEHMKDGAVLINTARGAILNEKDVAAALESGKLSGAGLDVLAVEPASSENPLLGAKNCIITPHAAWTALASRRRLMEILEKNLESFVKTGRGINEI